MYTYNESLASLGFVFVSYEKYVRESKEASKKPVSLIHFIMGRY